MANRRIARLNEQLKREISEVIRTDLRDPRIGGVVVTAVDTTADLFMSRVYVRPLGDDDARERAVEGLEAAAPFVRRELSQRLELRRVPEIHFQLDLTLEHAMRIEEILGDVRPDGGWPEEDEDEEDEGRNGAGEEDGGAGEGEEGGEDADGEDRPSEEEPGRDPVE